MYSFGNHQNQPDPQIWQAFKSGDESAYEYIYTQYFATIYNYGTRITSDIGLVEDCIQELFVEIWQNRQNLGDVQTIKFYLFKSIRRKIIEKLSKKNQSYEPLNDHYNFEVALSRESILIGEQKNQEQKEQIEKALQNLSRRQKEAIHLIFYDELPYEEVAGIMALKVRTVYNMVHNAIVILRKQLVKLPLVLFLAMLL